MALSVQVTLILMVDPILTAPNRFAVIVSLTATDNRYRYRGGK